jgi:prolipoprotein diacylglyceryltransferase
MPLVAYRIGNQPLFTYSLLMAGGLLAGVWVLSLEGQRRGWKSEQTLEVLAWTLVPAAVAGRLAYVVAQGIEGLLHPWGAPAASLVQGLLHPWGAPAASLVQGLLHPWGEGLLFPGALLGGAAGLAVLATWRRHPCLDLLGAVAPGLALGQTLAWLGAAVHGAGAGAALPADLGWGPLLRNLYGAVLPRFPLQYVASALSLLTWATLSRRLHGDRQRVACYALVTGWGLAGLETWREQHVALLAGLSAGQVGYLALGLLGLALLLAHLRRPAATPAKGIITGPNP